MILPDLQANGIEIIQIGKATDESIPSCKILETYPQGIKQLI